MIEILNEIFSPEISNNILKYMSHPISDIMKKEIDKTILKRNYKDDDDYRSDLYAFPIFFHLERLDNRNCDRCHKFKIYHTPRRFNNLNDTHLPYHLLKIPLAYDTDNYDNCCCTKCTFIDNLKCKLEYFRIKNKRRNQNGLSNISIVKYFSSSWRKYKENKIQWEAAKNYSREKWLFP